MVIELGGSTALHPCSFNAVIAPVAVLATALNTNADLRRFLFLYVSGNYSRLLTAINRSSKNFDVRRAFTAHQLVTILSEAGHTIVVVEHDPTLFEGAEATLPQIAGMLREAGRTALVILYAPAADCTFSALAAGADRIIEIAPAGPAAGRSAGLCRDAGTFLQTQRTLEVS